jgi:hypothetical protein
MDCAQGPASEIEHCFPFTEPFLGHQEKYMNEAVASSVFLLP